MKTSDIQIGSTFILISLLLPTHWVLTFVVGGGPHGLGLSQANWYFWMVGLRLELLHGYSINFFIAMDESNFFTVPILTSSITLILPTTLILLTKFLRREHITENALRKIILIIITFLILGFILHLIFNFILLSHYFILYLPHLGSLFYILGLMFLFPTEKDKFNICTYFLLLTFLSYFIYYISFFI